MFTFGLLLHLVTICNGLRESANYYLVEQAKNRNDAATYCQNTHGTKLASVHCDAQNTEIVTLINESPNADRAFIGAISNRNTFDDGSPKDFTWTNGGSQMYSGDCCSVEIIAGPYNFWNDLHYSHSRYFVCNKVAVLATCEINECEEGTDDCGQNADCVDEIDGFRCECQNGFIDTGDGKNCEDIDECSGGNDCNVNAACVNSIGGYTCSCNAGFTDISGDGTDCQDIDECAPGNTNECDAQATCSNSVGGYTCSCNTGYNDVFGDGFQCTDINECVTGANDCGSRAANAKCKNTAGGYECECVNSMRVDISCDDGEQMICTSDTESEWSCGCKNEVVGESVAYAIFDYSIWYILTAIIVVISLLLNIYAYCCKISFKGRNYNYDEVKYADSDTEAQAINVQ